MTVIITPEEGVSNIIIDTLKNNRRTTVKKAVRVHDVTLYLTATDKIYSYQMGSYEYEIEDWPHRKNLIAALELLGVLTNEQASAYQAIGNKADEVAEKAQDRERLEKLAIKYKFKLNKSQLNAVS